MLKRATGLSAITRAGAGKVLADPEARAYTLAVLDEINVSTPVAFKHKEKGVATAAMGLLAPAALQVQICFVGIDRVMVILVVDARLLARAICFADEVLVLIVDVVF